MEDLPTPTMRYASSHISFLSKALRPLRSGTLIIESNRSAWPSLVMMPLAALAFVCSAANVPSPMICLYCRTHSNLSIWSL